MNIKQPSELSPALKAVSEIGGMDVEAALKRLIGKQSILEKSVKLVASSINSKISELEGYVDNDMMSEFAFTMHGIKSSLGTIGAAERADAAASLEGAAKNGDKDYIKDHFGSFAEDVKDLGNRLIEICRDNSL